LGIGETGGKDVGGFGGIKMSNQHDSFLDSLPAGWNFDRLKDVATLRKVKTGEASADEDYLELEDLESGTGRILNRRNTLEVESAVTLFKKGDVLFGKLRPYLEKYYQADFNGKCTGEILAFKPERIASRFLFHCVGSRWFIGRCNALAYGAKMPRVSWEKQLSQINVPLPPLPDQQRIAAYLDASCGAIDAAVAAKRHQLESLDVLALATVQHAVTKGINSRAVMKPSSIDWLPEIPRHWEIQQIKRRCELLRGKFTHRPRNDPAFYDGEYPFVQTGNITSAEKYIHSYSQTLNELGLSVSKMFPKGTLVMSIAANVGDVAILDFEACFPDSMIGLVPNHHTDLDFLYYLLRAMKGIMLRSAVLTTQLNLNYVRIGTNFAPFPPKEEQEEIAEYLDAKVAAVKNVAKGIETQIATLTAYRKSLIHECVTGQRRITEADLAAAKRLEAHPSVKHQI
jgi:type I restriction enzyme S subunit